MNNQSKIRDLWVDNVKVFACILVVLGHFFQSMVLSDIIGKTYLTSWFDRTIYYFHVPLFFICSGYLYQKYSCVRSLGQWKDNFLKKLISLGIPYGVFTLVTWLLKSVFSSSVNMATDGLFTTLFVSPISPYWYLYALFFLFIITPTFDGKKTAMLAMIVSIIMKTVTFFSVETTIYAINVILQNEVWFVIGMCIYIFDLPSKFIANKTKTNITGGTLWILFIIFSLILCTYNIDCGVIGFAMGIIGCISTILISFSIYKFSVIKGFIGWCSKYTFPIYLMHTIFAAAFRIILMKIGITSAWVHIPAGVAISFVCPIIAAVIMRKIKFLDFMLYPGKYIFVHKDSRGEKE